MPLAGAAFLALWNDIAPAREAEYDRWHTREHVPERVGVPGFRGARRYVNRARSLHRYFTLYEIDDLAVLDGAAYATLLREPTLWSQSMRPDFAHVLRAPCNVVASEGEGIGGALAVLCYAATAVSRVVSQAMLMALPGVVGAHVGDGSATAVAWAPEEKTRGFDRVLLIEALDRDAAQHALAAARDALAFAALPADFGNDVYDLAFAFPGHDANAPARHARRPTT